MHTLLPLDLKNRLFFPGVGFPMQLEGHFQEVFIFALEFMHPESKDTHCFLFSL